MKTNKSFAKRIKVTKNGKMLSRTPGQNHFNAKESGKTNLNKKRMQTMQWSKKITRRFLPNT